MSRITIMFTFWTITTKLRKITIQWNIIIVDTIKITTIVIIDSKSIAFISCVILISAAVILYRKDYIREEKKKNIFIKTVITFVLSIFIIVIRPNIISLILGWEGLGIASFILIMFYQNKKSITRGFYTIIINRIGDIILILVIAIIININSWNFITIEYNKVTIMLRILITAAFSKRAQIPFSSWLTEAMAAPTPISALVHSSTLVTAGVIVLIRFERTFKYTKINLVIFTVRIITLIIARINSLWEWDIKKIVALSTLRQLRIIFISISINIYNLATFHILVHATFKALIFLSSRSFIRTSKRQDVRKIKNSAKNLIVSKTRFNLANLTLCGFPFISRFYSKEIIIEIIILKKIRLITIVFFYLCITCTLVYSIKIIIFINSVKSTITTKITKEQTEQKIRKIILVIPSILFGNKINWIININYKIPHIRTRIKVLPIIIIIITTIISQIIKKKNKIRNRTNKIFMSYMWFIKNINIPIKKKAKLNWFKLYKYSEKKTFTKIINLINKKIISLSIVNFTITHKNFKKIIIIILLIATTIIYLNSLNKA